MRQIPPNIEKVFEALKIEILWLHESWIIYRQLFGLSEKRIKLLNKCASVFFHLIQHVILREIIVTISKLTDPSRTGGKENLSLEQLQELVEIQGENQLVLDLRKLLDNLHNKTKDLRTWRHKQLAHFDLRTAIESSMNHLPGISRQMIEESLEIIYDYMNTIQIHYTGVAADYEPSMSGADGERLIVLLKFGLGFEKLIEENEVSFDDWNWGEWKEA